MVMVNFCPNWRAGGWHEVLIVGLQGGIRVPMLHFEGGMAQNSTIHIAFSPINICGCL